LILEEVGQLPQDLWKVNLHSITSTATHEHNRSAGGCLCLDIHRIYRHLQKWICRVCGQSKNRPFDIYCSPPLTDSLRADPSNVIIVQCIAKLLQSQAPALIKYLDYDRTNSRICHEPSVDRSCAA